MKKRENLDDYVLAYRNDPFERENMLSILNFCNKCTSYSTNKNNFLELGIGHGFAIRILSQYFKNILVLEGSPEIVKRYNRVFKNVEIQEVYFEDFETDKKFNNIGIGFILEHVDDPVFILNKFRKYLSKGGSIFIAVPNASSLHRLLGNKAGMLDNINLMSEDDLKFGHKRFLTYREWKVMIEKQGLKIVRAEGLYLKPFSTAQIESLHLNDKIYNALKDLASDYPEISNTCFLEVRDDR